MPQAETIEQVSPPGEKTPDRKPRERSPSENQPSPQRGTPGGNKGGKLLPPPDPSFISDDTLQFFGTADGQQKVDRMLRLGMNSHQQLLHRNLLHQLQSEFRTWVLQSRRDSEKRMQNAPPVLIEKWRRHQNSAANARDGSQAPRFVCDYLVQAVQARLDSIARTRQSSRQFRRNLQTLHATRDRQDLILHFARELGASERELQRDEDAFGRWFDAEAMNDRFLRRIGEDEMMLTFILARLAEACVYVFHRSLEIDHGNSNRNKHQAIDSQPDGVAGIWQRLHVESTLLKAMIHDGDTRVHVAAIRSLRVMLQSVPKPIAAELLSQRMLSFFDRAARQKNSDVWMQCEALTILATLSWEMARGVMQQRLSHPADGDDLFVRQHIWQLIEQQVKTSPTDDPGIELTPDESPFVRQKMSHAAFWSDCETLHKKWWHLTLTDADPKVRAAAVSVGGNGQLTASQTIKFMKLMPHVLQRETEPFVIRTACWAVTNALLHLQTSVKASAQASHSQAWFTARSIALQQLVPATLKIQKSHPSIPVRRFAAQANERIWAITTDGLPELLVRLRKEVAAIRPGQSRYLSTRWFDWMDEVTIGRVFAVLSQNDFGFDIRKSMFGYQITRGPEFGFRLWRWWFELCRSATDKRQGHRHTTGRISNATLRAPSQITGELSPTNVPGEPLVIADDGTWRPFLPLVDDFVSLLNMSWLKPKTMTFVTSQGVTRIVAPTQLRQRVTACWKLTLGFAKFASLRNLAGDAVASTTFLTAFEQLGFRITFQPHRYREVELAIEVPSEEANASPPSELPPQSQDVIRSDDDSVQQFFPRDAAAAVPFLGLNLIGQSQTPMFESLVQSARRFGDYFFSIYENSLEELVLFSILVLLFVVAKHFWANWKFRRSRRRIAISIGGWGTRGKSGTERLKAALLGKQGHSLVSKTTGCEAMFIHSHAFGQPLEIPLFRPYDKATIWEQQNLVNIAAEMDTSVFLWECMALTPDYVDVLQQQWMQDDLATITNTYPDHEDIQGPAGHNVAETISGFVPPRSLLVTTEEQMRPFVEQKCRDRDTMMQPVGWLESGLITDDILERFPYREHPDNIALVARMAQNLGITTEQSFKAMADDLIPDLGVLKTHPIAAVRGRRIEFTNGMSANERFGCMGNWQRLGYATHNHLEDPSTLICGVVNNRADRVPRSKVFAQLIVEDINADRFFLIGSNLSGLKNFISEAWETYQETLTLSRPDGSWERSHALEQLRRSATASRQILRIEDVLVRLRLMIEAVVRGDTRGVGSKIAALVENVGSSDELAVQLKTMNIDPPLIAAISQHYDELHLSLHEYRALVEMVEDAPETISETVNEKFRETKRKWFQRKIFIVEDVDATGEEVIESIVDAIPPGYLARVMGLQNIKGTGLDFVYRFHAWDVCHEACEATRHRDAAIVEKALDTLLAKPDIGQLCLEPVRQAIDRCRENRSLQNVEFQSRVVLLEQRLDAAEKKSAPPASADQEAGTESQTNSSDRSSADRSEQLRQWVYHNAEQFLDVNDSIRRRDKADRIYRDLKDGRISRQRAILELRNLNKRQKGGWLKEQTQRLQSSLFSAAR